jgi:hypothetical protein
MLDVLAHRDPRGRARQPGPWSSLGTPPRPAPARAADCAAPAKVARPCAAGPGKISSTRLSPGSAIGRFASGEEPMSAVLPGDPGAVATAVGAGRRAAALDIRLVESEDGGSKTWDDPKSPGGQAAMIRRRLAPPPAPGRSLLPTPRPRGACPRPSPPSRRPGRCAR